MTPTTAEPKTGRAPRITRASLMTLEAYAKARADFRARVLAHKHDRTVHLGEHLTLIFEDELTMRYQIQEMLRIEKIFDEDGIRSEIEAYDPLVPDGSNFKATMLIEYEDADERRRALAPCRKRSIAAAGNRLGVPPPKNTLCTLRPHTSGRSTSRSASSAST